MKIILSILLLCTVSVKAQFVTKSVFDATVAKLRAEMSANYKKATMYADSVARKDTLITLAPLVYDSTRKTLGVRPATVTINGTIYKIIYQ